MNDKTFKELAPYCEEIYNAYVENFGSDISKKLKSTGRKRSPFETELHELVDDSKMDLMAYMFIKYYVTARLNGDDESNAFDSAKTNFDRNYGVGAVRFH